MKKTIVMTAAGTELSFNVSTADYNQYINEVMPDNKVAPNHNLLMRTVDAAVKQPLADLLEANPGAAIQLGSTLAAEFAPQLEITVKK